MRPIANLSNYLSMTRHASILFLRAKRDPRHRLVPPSQLPPRSLAQRTLHFARTLHSPSCLKPLPVFQPKLRPPSLRAYKSVSALSEDVASAYGGLSVGKSRLGRLIARLHARKQSHHSIVAIEIVACPALIPFGKWHAYGGSG